VARSARSLPVAVLVIAAAGLLAGCVSTQTTAARLRINNSRILASQVVTRVRATEVGGSTTVTAIRTLDRGKAFVVTIVNDGRQPVSNLPISVGYRAHGKTVYLNARVGLPYFADHTAEIPSRSTLRWVYPTGVRLPSGARPFAYVGSQASPAVAVDATAGVSARAVRRKGSQWVVQLTNLTGIPQYQLPVYLYVRKGGRIIGAGEATIADLNGGATATALVTVIGTASAGNVAVAAPATIYN
jgi:hypothetical protein